MLGWRGHGDTGTLMALFPKLIIRQLRLRRAPTRTDAECARNDSTSASSSLEHGIAEHDALTCWSRAFCAQQGLIQDEQLREAMARVGLP